MALRNVEERRRVPEFAFVPIGGEARVLRAEKLFYAGTFPSGDEAREWVEDTKSGVGSWPSLRVQPVPREPESLMRLRCVLGVEMRI
jgi:hypothetical protein